VPHTIDEQLNGLSRLDSACKYIAAQYGPDLCPPVAAAHFDTRAILLTCFLNTLREIESRVRSSPSGGRSYLSHPVREIKL
jgi:hypothetical protein